MTKPAHPSAEHLTAFVEQFHAALVPAMQRMGEQLAAMAEAMKPIIEHAERHPELFRMAAPGLADEPTMGELEAVTDTCRCHCWINHPGEAGVCGAASDPGYEINGQPACASCEVATNPL